MSRCLTSLIRRSAELHLAHICGNGDPFELGSARPLDFGHWAAHKLESMTHHRLRHGEAVAIGLALDVTYSVKKGYLAPDCRRAHPASSGGDRIPDSGTARSVSAHPAAVRRLSRGFANSASTSAASCTSPCCAASVRDSKSPKWTKRSSRARSTSSRLAARSRSHRSHRASPRRPSSAVDDCRRAIPPHLLLQHSPRRNVEATSPQCWLPRCRASARCSGTRGQWRSDCACRPRRRKRSSSRSELTAFREFLRAGDYYVLTINGFPYGAFHGQRVKEQVYRPDWRDDARLEYTEPPRALTGRSPGGSPRYRRQRQHGAGRVPIRDHRQRRRARHGDPDAPPRGRARLDSTADRRHHHARDRARAGVLHRDDRRCASRSFAITCSIDALVQQVGREVRAIVLTVDDVRRHVGLCFDACHMAVEFEDPRVALERLDAAGIRVCKVQISSALRIDPVDTTARCARSRRSPKGRIYIRSSSGRPPAWHRYVDLPEAIAAAARRRGRLC